MTNKSFERWALDKGYDLRDEKRREYYKARWRLAVESEKLRQALLEFWRVLCKPFLKFYAHFFGSDCEGRLAWNEDDSVLEIRMPGGKVVIQASKDEYDDIPS